MYKVGDIVNFYKGSEEGLVLYVGIDIVQLYWFPTSNIRTFALFGEYISVTSSILRDNL